MQACKQSVRELFGNEKVGFPIEFKTPKAHTTTLFTTVMWDGCAEVTFPTERSTNRRREVAKEEGRAVEKRRCCKHQGDCKIKVLRQTRRCCTKRNGLRKKGDGHKNQQRVS